MIDFLMENPSIAILIGLCLLWLAVTKYSKYMMFESVSQTLGLDGSDNMEVPMGAGEQERLEVMQQQNDQGCHVNAGWGSGDPMAYNEGEFSESTVSGVQTRGGSCGLEQGNHFGTPSSVENAPMNSGPISSSDLLPQSKGDLFQSIQPTGEGGLDRNFLLSSHHIGINTVGTSRKNANLQLRSEPPNPQGTVSPWNNSVITHDNSKRQFDIGSC